MDNYKYYQMTSNQKYSNPDLYEPTVNVSNHEIATLIRHLQNQPSTKRLEVLKTIRRLVKRAGNHLPEMSQQPCFDAIHTILADDRRPTILCECLWLIVDVIPSMGHNLDSCMATILPQIVPNLGHESADVRRASLRLLHVYMRYTNNLQRVLKKFIQYGLESKDSIAQKGVVISLPLLFTEEFSNENLYLLVESLGKLLVSADTNLFYPVFLAMQRLHSIIGNDVFKLYLDRINKEANTLYRSVLSRNSTANSEGRDEQPIIDPTVLERKPDRKSVTIRDEPIEIERIISPGNSNAANSVLKQFKDQKAMGEELGDSSNSDEVTYVPPQPFRVSPMHQQLRYGVFPHSVIFHSNSPKIEEKLDGIQAVFTIIRESPLKHLSQLVPFMDEFLTEFVSQLLEQSNFKVTLSALDMIEVLVERLKLTMISFMRPIVAILYRRLGDGRTVIRDSVIKVFHQLMYTLPPQDMLDILLQQKASKNPKIREEVINRVTAAVLTFPRNEFNLSRLSFNIAPMLTDNRRMVRLAALECLAVLAQALGPHKLGPLLAAADAIESSCECEGLVSALQARLARRQLPRCAADGTIRYVLNPQQFTGWFNSSADADLEWVMLASASNSGTPPKAVVVGSRKISNGTISGIPGSIPFDRRRSTVVTIPPNTTQSEDSDEPPDLTHIRKSLAINDIDKFLSVGQSMGLEVPNTNRLQSMDRIQEQMPERQSYLDNFKGESFNSDENDVNERRASDDSRASSLEVWRHYFSRFKKQLAEAALCRSSNSDSVFSGSPILPDRLKQDSLENNYNMHYSLQRRKSEIHLTKGYANPNEDIKGENNNQSPIQSSSAPSTASGDMSVQYFPPIMSSSQEQVVMPVFDQTLERSMSLPSIVSRPNSGLIVEDRINNNKSSLELDKNNNENQIWDNNKANEGRASPKDYLENGSVPMADSQLDLDAICTNKILALKNSQEFIPQDIENVKLSPPRSASHLSLNKNGDKYNSNPMISSAPATPLTEPVEEVIPLRNVESLPVLDLAVDENTLKLPPNDNHVLNEPSSEPPMLSIQEATPLHHRRSSSVTEPLTLDNRPSMIPESTERLDVSTQKDETLSSGTSTDVETQEPQEDNNLKHIQDENTDNNNKPKEDPNSLKANSKLPQSKTPNMKRRAQPIRRASKSQSPQRGRRPSRLPQQIYIKTTPAIPANANIRHILANVAKTEGPFENPSEACKAALMALHDDAWTTKVEGMLAIARLATFHSHSLLKDQHQIVLALVFEVKNLRSTVSRSAIFTIGELFAKLRTQIEPEMDAMVQALLHKAGENVVFIREDIERALINMIEEMPQTRAAISLIINGSNHRNTYVRKTCAQFLSILVDKMGAIKCLLGPRDIGEHLLPAAARFVQDQAPHTRYFGRKIFSVLMNHNAFDKLLRKHVSPGTYRNICGILESIKRRGIGDRPTDLASPLKSTPIANADQFDK